MPRPTKCRRVCHFPQTLEFLPAQEGEEKIPVLLTIDEYETIRLIDVEGMNQEECAGHMNIARTTVQGIYLEARKKLAQVLVEGRVLYIEGGDYQLCDGQNSCCRKGRCHKHHAGHGHCGTADEPESK